MTDTPDDENAVKEAMGKKRTVKLTVVDGGKTEDKPKRTRKPKVKPEEETPPAPEAGDPGPDESDVMSGPDDFGNNEGLEEAERIVIRWCAGLDQNDRDNGRRLVAWFGENLRYVTGLGWLFWRGSHWARDEADLEVRLLAQYIVDKIKLEAIELEASERQKRMLERSAELLKKKEDLSTAEERVIKTASEIMVALSKRRSSRIAWAVTSGNSGRTKAMLEQAQSLKALPIERLDFDHMLFNVANGTLRFWRELDPDQPEGGDRKIGRFEFRPHDRDDLITKVAEAEYHPDATCPFFIEDFLGKVQPESRWRTFIQVSTAVALLFGGNDEQKLFYHYGTGANGKSAFFELIGRLAGSYRQIASPETITGDGQRAGQQANPDIARLHNARLVTIEELPKNTPLKEELIKALTGGTKILARFLNKDFFEFMPQFTPMLSGNNKPAISGTDEGIWRRFLFIIWGVKIPEGERMAPTLLAARLDAERSGVLNWLIEGALLYLTHGLDHFTPHEAKAFAQDYREERDNVGVFAEACIERIDGQKVKAGVLFEAYETWCKGNGLRAASQRSFGDRLNDLNYKKQRGNFYFYLDVQLKANQATPADADGPPQRDPSDPGF
ncbi:MAG: phage/plasmid primase, P4 family [Candidatus Devosia phytovorans]|uniref:Phage/plasmid primase, P4 family n=1 Tax=Candidatus Devosia phytovorans TaxID=3121372 RepID=A0AAJ5VW82_9HYPH|nr:phage/plasmid primase, P4 family [Devosia sp.]WEK04548.1 MAG: phage/plasmid primase, P4 family [Devosia sp.]